MEEGQVNNLERFVTDEAVQFLLDKTGADGTLVLLFRETADGSFSVEVIGTERWAEEMPTVLRGVADSMEKIGLAGNPQS